MKKTGNEEINNDLIYHLVSSNYKGFISMEINIDAEKRKEFCRRMNNEKI